MFSLAPVRDALDGIGVSLDVFFARLLRDGFALTAAGDFRRFPDVARAALVALAPHTTTDERQHVLDVFTDLPAHSDVTPALQRLTAAGTPAIALTNGTSQSTEQLLRRAGLDGHVARVVSVDEVCAWKPAPQPYLHAAAAVGVAPADLALVAVHAWDIHGARRAGLGTGWCARLEGRYPEILDPPDVTGTDLVEVVERLLALPANP
jgi:2-haloacid dehalogenase